MNQNDIAQLLTIMCRLHDQNQFIPILEADICAFLYHLVISHSLCTPDRIHMDTRVRGSNSPNEKFDLAIGVINYPALGRPTIIPDLVGELKIFPIGFTDSQHNVHFHSILENDLRKLGQLNYVNTIKVEILYDERDYLSGKCRGINKDKMIIDTRNAIAAGTYLIFARKINEVWNVSIR